LQALVADSRHVRAGSCFIALAGTHYDARAHIPAAIDAGAAAVLTEADSHFTLHTVINHVPVLAVPGLGEMLGLLAARWYGQPSQAMTVLATTGTNGKTSIANLLAGACSQLGQRAAVIGTLGNGFPGELTPALFTTPDPLQLQSLLADFRDQGAQVVALEASSHGLSQGRLNGSCIHTALFTNLTRDHLDYHGDMASYAASKASLFRWPELHAAVINVDDIYAAEMLAELAGSVQCLRYSLKPGADAELVAESVEATLDGLCVELRTPAKTLTLKSPLIGRFNASNLLAVVGGLLTIGHDIDAIVGALAKVSPVPGRMQCLREPGTPLVVVDYAHTPDALAQALSAAREHASAKVWVVFGCGGGRDTGKRPEMGRIAGDLADYVVITSDNPREEDPQAIIDHVRSGVPSDRAVRCILDRGAAIAYVLAEAAEDDLVLVAGKGHETYQEVHGVRTPFSDVEQVRMALLLRSRS
jgi:UDP-N-acetylmuramyl-tripeptide synthetase